MTHTTADPQPADVVSPAPGWYRLDTAHSSVIIRTRHLFGLAMVHGTMEVAGGEITVDPAIPHASVTVTLSAASFSTGNDRRDRDVRSARFLDAEHYPDITFAARTLSRERGRWTLVGELIVRQVSSPVVLFIEQAGPPGCGFRAHGTTRIDRYACGVTAAKGMAARYLDIEVTVAAEPW